MKRATKRLELDPNFAFGNVWLGRVYARKGMYQEAIARIKKGLSVDEDEPKYLGALVYTYGLSGDRDKALEIVQQLTLLSKRRYVPPYDIALVYVGLGEKNSAFDWLQKAFADRSINLVHLRSAKEMGAMRSDPRYIELVRRIGLPQ